MRARFLPILGEVPVGVSHPQISDEWNLSMSGISPGWYVADGDAAGTHRYWNGSQWATDAQPIPTQSAASLKTETSTPPERWTPDAALAERAAEHAAAAAAGLPSTADRPRDPFNSGGEAATADRTTASVWHRYLANAIDGFLSSAVIALITLLLVDRTGQTITGVETPMSWYVVSFLFTAVYDIGLAMAFFATPGKLIMRIEIVSQTGHHADSTALFIRGLVRFVVMLAWHVVPPVIGIFLFVYAMLNVLMIFFDPKRQSLPDKIAKTRVVKAEGLNQWNHQH